MRLRRRELVLPRPNWAASPSLRRCTTELDHTSLQIPSLWITKNGFSGYSFEVKERYSRYRQRLSIIHFSKIRKISHLAFANGFYFYSSYNWLPNHNSDGEYKKTKLWLIFNNVELINRLPTEPCNWRCRAREFLWEIDQLPCSWIACRLDAALTRSELDTSESKSLC